MCLLWDWWWGVPRFYLGPTSPERKLLNSLPSQKWRVWWFCLGVGWTPQSPSIWGQLGGFLKEGSQGISPRWWVFCACLGGVKAPSCRQGACANRGCNRDNIYTMPSRRCYWPFFQVAPMPCEQLQEWDNMPNTWDTRRREAHPAATTPTPEKGGECQCFSTLWHR